MSKKSDKKTVLITGAGGFLGSELIRQLSCKEEFNVFALTSEKGKLKNRFGESNKLSIYSLQDWEKQKVPLEKVDTVIHCAFSRSEEGKSLAKSLEFTYDVLNQSSKAGVASFINISSRSVYGQNPDTPWSVQSTISPDSIYALAKYSSELLTNSYAAQTGLFIANIRLAGLVGPELNERIVNKFILQALKGESIIIRGGNQQFAYLDVRDAADGIVALLMKAPETWRPIYNLGYFNSYSITEIAETVARVAIQYNCTEVDIIVEKTEEMLYAEMDSTLFFADTNWKPKYNMEKIVATIFENLTYSKFS